MFIVHRHLSIEHSLKVIWETIQALASYHELFNNGEEATANESVLPEKTDSLLAISSPGPQPDSPLLTSDTNPYDPPKGPKDFPSCQ